MDPLDALALAGITLVAVVLILEGGHFTARSIHARNAVKRQMGLAREVQEALARTSAVLPREPEAQAAEIVVEKSSPPATEAADQEEAVATPGGTPPPRRRRRQPAPATAGAAPLPSYFPLTEPQRRLLQGLAVGQAPPPVGDRLGTDVMLEWLATLGFVQRGAGEADYVITPLGRRVLGGAPQA